MLTPELAAPGSSYAQQCRFYRTAGMWGYNTNIIPPVSIKLSTFPPPLGEQPENKRNPAVGKEDGEEALKGLHFAFLVAHHGTGRLVLLGPLR